MAKTASVKHNPLSNPRSRASKRQTSPSINTDKSLKEVSPHRESGILAPRSNAGVSKHKSKVQKSSRQKQRDAKRQDRAEVVMEKMEVRVGQKMKKGKAINERKSEWGVVNGAGKEARRQAVLAGLKNDEDNAWQDVEDGDEEGKMEEVVENGALTVPSPVPIVPVSVDLATIDAVASEETIGEVDLIT